MHKSAGTRAEDKSERLPHPCVAEREAAALGALVRLRQIVEELRSAAGQNNLEVVMSAAALLGPTTDQCRHLPDIRATGAGQAAQIALQIHSLLAECEAILTTNLEGVGTEMKRIQQGKRAMAQARRHKPMPTPIHTILK